MLVLVALTLAAASAARAQGDSRAGLVVQFGDGSVQTACVRFSEEQISGVELLERSGLPVITQSGGIGAAVCKIGPDGCNYPAEGCFCKRDGARSIYWAFYTRSGDAWAFSNLGAANTAVRDGAVHGWAWGLGDSGGGAQPPALSLDAVCGAAPAPPTAAPAPAPPTAVPTAVPTVPPTVPPTVAPTAVPTEAPAATARPTEAPAATENVAATETTAATETPAATETAAATGTVATTETPAATSPPTAAAATATLGPAGGVAPTQATPSAGGSSQGGLIGFAALALILGAGVIIAARRR
jgi:hypothetical protein